MKKIIVLNHKNLMNYDDVKNYIKNIKDYIRSDLDVIMCPSDIFIPYFKGRYSFKLGCQNLSGLKVTGCSTGEQLKSLDVRYAIIGHSERKLNFGETNKTINLNIKNAVNNNIVPIVCVGETKEEFDRKKAAEVIVKQLKDYFYDIDVQEDIIIAYEPIWAIGTGIIPDLVMIEEVVSLIKDIMFRKYNVNIKVLYGGSVNLSSIDKFNKLINIDGYLIGKESCNASNVLKIMNKM